MRKLYPSIASLTLLALSMPSAHAAEPRAATPKNNPADWVSNNDYPAEAVEGNLEGTVGFRVTISHDGTVKSCAIANSSGSTLLDDATCRLVAQRAKFYPARGMDGLPSEGSYQGRIRWTLPKDSESSVGDSPQPPSLRPYDYTMIFVKHADGTVSECKFLERGKDISDTPAGKFGCEKTAVLPIVRDANGNPTTKRVVIHGSMTLSDP